MSVGTRVAPVACFEVEVVHVLRLSPSFVRVTLGGDELAGFDGCGPLGPRDLRIKLIVPAGGGTAPIGDLSPGWYPRWLALDPRERGEMRTYSVRRARVHDPRPEIDVDLVLHEPKGPAGGWAETARPGDTLPILGPARGQWQEYGGIEWAPPGPGTGPLLLAGDETAVPAVASVLETLPSGYIGDAVLEVPDAEDFQYLSSPAEVKVTWLARGDRPHGELLTAWVRDVAPPAYSWVAGEAAVVRALRRMLVRDHGVPREAVTFMGYWRLGGAL
jgi:iron complex transport system ATP-binding protein